MSGKARTSRTILFLLFALNLFALATGLGSRALAGRMSQGSIAGAAFLLVLIANPVCAVWFGFLARWDRRTAGRPGVAYLAITPPALIAMMAGNFLLSTEYEPLSGAALAAGLMVYGGYAAICLLGAWAVLAAARGIGGRKDGTAAPGGGSRLENGAASDNGAAPRGRVVGMALGIVACAAVVGFTGLMAYLVLFGGRVAHRLAWYAIAGATFGPFWGGAAFHAAVLCALLASGFRSALRRCVPAVLLVALGALILIVQLLPLAAVPVYVRRAERSFESLLTPHGPELRGPGPRALPRGFKDRYFSLTGYFLGIPREDCEIRRDVRFFAGATASLPRERNLELYFDAFLPQGGSDSSPRRPVLIRIHGGGWRLGDKGRGNMMQMNRYFAAQGYAVFDVQYGLKGDPGDPPVITPSHVLGPFDLDDMMRHLGYFSRYLQAHAAEYGADLDTVFISGGSAGGQLACALSLSLAGDLEPELFGEGSTVRGLVPFYPANGVSESWIEGQSRWRNPENLVGPHSPPCLVFQGAQDAMVPPETSRRLCRAYANAGNPSCAVLLFPFAPHAADIYFPGYYNQVFLYFMERWMHLQR